MIRHSFTELLIEEITRWVGSVGSLVLHTLAFIAAFIAAVFGWLPWDTMLLVVTTMVSLEAIYLAIFIQMTVNRQAKELREVSQDVDEIQEDIDEIQEDVEEISEDVDEMAKDVDEIAEDVEELSDDWDLGTGKSTLSRADTITALRKEYATIVKKLEELDAKP